MSWHLVHEDVDDVLVLVVEVYQCAHPAEHLLGREIGQFHVPDHLHGLAPRWSRLFQHHGTQDIIGDVGL